MIIDEVSKWIVLIFGLKLIQHRLLVVHAHHGDVEPIDRRDVLVYELGELAQSMSVLYSLLLFALLALDQFQSLLSSLGVPVFVEKCHGRLLVQIWIVETMRVVLGEERTARDVDRVEADLALEPERVNATVRVGTRVHLHQGACVGGKVVGTVQLLLKDLEYVYLIITYRVTMMHTILHRPRVRLIIRASREQIGLLIALEIVLDDLLRQVRHLVNSFLFCIFFVYFCVVVVYEVLL